jgi:F-box interacting protein
MDMHTFIHINKTKYKVEVVLGATIVYHTNLAPMGGDRLVKKTKHKHRSKTRHLQLKTTTDNPSPPPLPEDLIGQILHRLPVKSLLPLKCVSKSWQTLISDPQFTKKQLQFSIAKSNLCPIFISSICTTVSLEGRKIVSYNAESVLEAKSADSIATNSKSFDFMDDYLIFGSCNGLLCVFQPGENSLILWNPCMNLKSETSITFVSPFGENGFISYHGFGCYDYDQDHVKYKLLIVSYNVDDFSETVTRIYTSGEDSWRTIQDFPYGSSSADENRYLGKFVSGNLNWLAKKEDGDIKQEIILSFDIEKETFGEVLLPQLDGEDVRNDILDVVGNCLCLCCDYIKTHWVVWLMKEYGVAESWTKLMIIHHFKPILTEPRRVYRWNLNMSPSFVNPLFNSEYDIVIVKTVRSRLMLHNIIKGSSSLRRPCRWIRFDDLQIYHESLVLPQW